ncbi:uncharacterized protein LOC116781305 [Chiroxiphia lanceolata]|uniref:uncharacterized protein LOC116781305 n=1 Tax=Chiroxiphia lanceolata TaxID=296741 RepID=UPI0013CE5793|nr:uncharacterized protein LOC116781305 [Chiroxiphia lanceolata]
MAGALEAFLRNLETQGFSEVFPTPLAGALEAFLQDLETRSFSQVSLIPVAGALETLLQDLETRSFSEASPIPVAGGLKAILQDLVSRSFSEASLLQVPSTPDCGMAGRRFSLLRLLRRKKEEENPGAAPAQQPEEVQQMQPPQEDAGQERTEEQLRARGRFRRAAQLVCRFIRCIWHEEATFMATGDTANSDLFSAQTSAALLDLLVENSVYKAKQVPAIVRCIHQWLTSNVSDEHRLDKTLVLLTEAHPVDVAVTLLRSAPACDRYGTHLPSGLTCL